MRILGFDWDAVNIGKLAVHELTPEDVEELFLDGRPCFAKHPQNQKRMLALGFAPGERFVLVVFEYNQETRWVRVVTAYEPTSERWWKAYERGIKSQEAAAGRHRR